MDSILRIIGKSDLNIKEYNKDRLLTNNIFQVIVVFIA